MNAQGIVAEICEPDLELPLVAHRPLGRFSDYVCEELGMHNEQVRHGRRSVPELREIIERQAESIDESHFSDLLIPRWQIARRTALLDLVWALRSLDVGYAGETQNGQSYSKTKRQLRVFRLAKALADAEHRHPVLSWSDIAIYHPVHDPRTFLAAGRARDEEILMYRIQSALETIFKDIIEADWRVVTQEKLSVLVANLNVALKGLAHFTRVRTPGQFYELDPYLGPNHEYRGHATGAFSAWTYLVGVLLSANPSFAKRLVDASNRMAFDRDAHVHIDRLRNGQFTSLVSVLEQRARPKATASKSKRSITRRAGCSESFCIAIGARSSAMRRRRSPINRRPRRRGPTRRPSTKPSWTWAPWFAAARAYLHNLFLISHASVRLT